MKSLLESIWKSSRTFVIASLADLFKAVVTLFGLSVFYGFIRLMALMGYADQKLKMFENVHFWGSYSVLGILGIVFVLRLALSPFAGAD